MKRTPSEQKQFIISTMFGHLRNHIAALSPDEAYRGICLQFPYPAFDTECVARLYYKPFEVSKRMIKISVSRKMSSVEFSHILIMGTNEVCLNWIDDNSHQTDCIQSLEVLTQTMWDSDYS